MGRLVVLAFAQAFEWIVGTIRMASVFFSRIGYVLFLMCSYPSLVLSLAMIDQLGTLGPIPRDVVLGPKFTLEWVCLESVWEFRVRLDSLLLISWSLFDPCIDVSISICALYVGTHCLTPNHEERGE